MVQVDLTDIVKEKLERFKEKEGCKTFSEAVNLLLTLYSMDQKDES